jgi:hypothetical protein
MGNTSSRKDMAVCLVIFNPASTKRILMNYLFVINKFKLEKLPLFSIELVFENREPEIVEAIHVRSKSFLFHKERLYRILEKTIPSKYTKLAFLDADIVFDDISWYDKTSELLDKYDVVQPFERAHWLDLTYADRQLTRETAVKMTEKEYSTLYHPGFAWCMRREWYNKTGFFDYAVSGSGDALSVAGWLKKKFPKHFKSCPKSIEKAYQDFFAKPAPKITFLKGMEVSHLYHGSREKRQYVSRHELLETNKDIRTLLKINSDGVFDWVNPAEWNPKFLNYFQSRNDDDLSLENISPIALKLDSNTVLTS